MTPRFAGLAGILIILSPLGTSLASAQTPCRSTVIGDLHIDQFASETYQRQQTVRVWLPPGYNDAANTGRKYKVLYLLDGQTAFDECTAFRGEHELQVDETITRLLAQHRIVPLIVVGIDSYERRSYEYLPYKDVLGNAGGPEPIGTKLPDFLVSEVLPYVAAHYRVAIEPRDVAIGGTSNGGIAAAYTLLHRPDRFRLGLIESATLPDGNGALLRETEFLARGPDRVYIGVGTTELAIPGGDKFAAQLGVTLNGANAGFAKMSEALANNLRSAFLNHPDIQLVVEPNGTHTSTSWARRLPRAIQFLFGAP